MHFLIRETISFNLIYVAACYPVGTGMCHNMVGLLQHYLCLWIYQINSSISFLHMLYWSFEYKPRHVISNNVAF